MEMTTGGVAAPAAESARAAVRFDPLWAGCALIAAALLVTAFFLPLWKMTLLAPQYPDDIHLTAYGTDMTGDLQEINSLNHYAGVKPIEPENVRELDLFPFLLFGFVAVILVAAFLQRRSLRWAVVTVAWGFPIGFLADLQYWLWNYGHDLNEDAPLYPGPFTPKVLGGTKVVNFHSETMVTWGYWCMIAAALLVTFGPWTVRFLRGSWQNTGSAPRMASFAGAVLLLVGAGLVGRPAGAHATAGQDLQAMIDAAAPGSTLTVPAGAYSGPIVIDKTLTVEGVGWPVIDGGRKGDVVKITADGVTLRGFVIQGSLREVSDEPAGIRLQGDRAVVENNRVRDVLYGITLQESDGHIVRNNSIQSVLEFPPERRGHALYLYYTNDNLLEGNVISHAKDGVFINFSARNRVIGNRVTDLRYGIHFMYANQSEITGNTFRDNLTGASIMYSVDLYFEGNEFANNRSFASGYGLLFKDVDNVELVGNLIHHNTIGLTMEGAPLTPGTYMRLRDNLIGFNQVALFLSTTVAAEFGGNSFTGNLRQVETKGGSLEHSNRWQLDGRGNYWDDYQGYDADGDGMGDMPYHYRTAYDELIKENEALKAFSYTPAQTAIDLASRWFPVYTNPPAVVDDHPLMGPTMKLPSSSGANSRLWATLALAALAIAPLTMFKYAGNNLQRRW